MTVYKFLFTSKGRIVNIYPKGYTFVQEKQVLTDRIPWKYDKLDFDIKSVKTIDN